jgi:hypothetical protein
MRTSERITDPKLWPYRSTWLLRNKWTRVEESLMWAALEDPRAKIKPLAEKGIWRFEHKLISSSAPGQIIARDAQCVGSFNRHKSQGVPQGFDGP